MGDVIGTVGKLGGGRCKLGRTRRRHDFSLRSVEFKTANKNVNLKEKLRCRGMKFERWLRNQDSPC